MTDYKPLAKELYEMLDRVSDFIEFDRFPLPLAEELGNLSQKYKEETTRGTGRTTALYIECITEALKNPGKSIEFKDHYPHTVVSAKHHADNLETIIVKLDYDIMISRPTNSTQVFLYNKFVK